VKFGCAVAFTVKAIVVVCVVEPEVPVIVTVAVPVVAVEDAVKVSVDPALPLAGGVTGFGENAAVTPLGRPDALSVVAALKPFRLVTVMVLVPLPPCVTVTDDGDAPTEKSGVAVVVHPGNLKFAIRVFQLKLPVVFMYSSVNQKVQSSTGSTCRAL
jgi:L-lactate permease